MTDKIIDKLFISALIAPCGSRGYYVRVKFLERYVGYSKEKEVSESFSTANEALEFLNKTVLEFQQGSGHEG